MDVSTPLASPTGSTSTTGDSFKSILEYDENDVHDFCARLGLEGYAWAFREHGIDGQSLPHLDHAMLRELGIASVGLRLAFLRSVYEEKRIAGIPLGEGDWLPPFSASLSVKTSPPPVYSQETPCPAERRCTELEQEVSDLRNEVDELQELVHSLAYRFVDAETSITELKRTRPRSNTLHKPSLSVDTSGRSTKPARPVSPPIINSPTDTDRKEGQPKSTRPRPAAFDAYLEATPSPLRSAARSGRVFESPSGIATTPLLGTGSSIPHRAVSPTSAKPPTSASEIKSVATALVRPSMPTRSASSRSASSRSSQDTCLTILPAAVKKYGLKSDWSSYVMIVSCDKHKRALSYDERPRVVVEELRQAGEKPSCLVQHQSELRSPLALAHSRRTKAFRRLLNAGATSDAAAAASIKDEDQLLPVLAAPKSGSPSSVKYALSIYPYSAQRSDETDLDYGCVYLIVAREGDGFVSVHRLDHTSSSSSPQSGLVPLVCLLELHHAPPTSLSPSREPLNSNGSSARSATPKTIEDLDPSLPATAFVATSALLDRSVHGSGEIAFKKGDNLRVYLRCSHWSFALLERSHEAGWVPSWLISSGSASTSAREVPQLPERKDRIKPTSSSSSSIR